MSSYQNNLSGGAQLNGLTTTSAPSSNSAPSYSSNGVASTVSVLNNGPSSSPITMPVSGSPVAARATQPEQIIVPLGNVMNSASKLSTASNSQTSHSASSSSSSPAAAGGSDNRGVLDRTRLRELVKEVDPLEQMDDDVEDVLLQVADDFIENVVASSCQLAKHRRSNTLEAKDVQLYLERSWNMQIPGFGSDEIRPYKKSFTTEAHKQRMALIRKTLKKY
ncbi:transcription initiation factor tfiid subunit 12 [Plakobranchus ocellatus]|uniref:Transcription initiation factor TFIID subunit 12 n=1 Tax=Plakobranchus ocellatus TaxID=259542 RepID=A0AAV3Y0F0_9GAST|nr:transcription initiation factor tfiid subunit 12 [Plakobranchus ocellatus]